MKTLAIKKIKKLNSFNIDTLNSIANRTGISLTLAVFYYHATH